MAARPERLSRDFILLQLRGFPGEAHGCALPPGRWRQAAIRAYAERLGPGRRAHADRGDGELSGERRLDPRAGCAHLLYGRAEPDRLTRLTARLCSYGLGSACQHI